MDAESVGAGTGTGDGLAPAGVAPAVPWHKSMDWGGGAGFTVPEKVAEFKTAAELAKAYENARTKIQSKGILIPKEGEDRSGFDAELKKHLGLVAPDKPEGYEWAPPDDLKDFYPDMADRFAELHAKGIDKATAKQILDSEAEGIARAQTAIQEAQVEMARESEAALKEEWGDDYPRRLAAVTEQAERFPEAYDFLKSVGGANNVHVIKMMDEVSRSIREAPVEKGAGITRESARDQINELNKRQQALQYRRSSPEYAENEAKLKSLYKNMVK